MLGVRGTPRCIAAACLMAATLSACSSAASAPASFTASPAVSAAPGTAAFPSATAPPTAAATLADCPAARTAASLNVVHRFAAAPDDITVDAAGRILVTTDATNQLFGMDQGGGMLTVETVAHGPEGVVVDGAAVYVAEQDVNAIVELRPQARTLVALPGRSGNLGVDGLGIDSVHRRLLIPGSPTGVLYALPLDAPTAQLQPLASGLGRPVAATTDNAGTIYVASESSPALSVLTSAGTRRALGAFTDLDEVVWFGGLLYVTELDHHDVLAVDPASGASVRLATGLPSPQGLAVTAAGVLELVDATTNTLYSLPACAAR